MTLSTTSNLADVVSDIEVIIVAESCGVSAGEASPVKPPRGVSAGEECLRLYTQAQNLREELRQGNTPTESPCSSKGLPKSKLSLDKPISQLSETSDTKNVSKHTIAEAFLIRQTFPKKQQLNIFRLLCYSAGMSPHSAHEESEKVKDLYENSVKIEDEFLYFGDCEETRSSQIHQLTQQGKLHLVSAINELRSLAQRST